MVGTSAKTTLTLTTSYASFHTSTWMLTVQNAPVFPIPNSHFPDKPLPSTRQVWRRLRAILQVLLAPTLSPTRCIPAFTPSYIIPWCVPPTNTLPHPGHVSLGTTSPLLLQSFGLSPVDLSSLPSSLDISVRPLCSYLNVPTISPSALLPHLDMMSQIFLLHHFLRCFRPSCGICFSFLQRILAHQNFAGVRHLTRGRHLITPSARLCLYRQSRHGRRRLFAFNLSLLRQRQQFQETRIFPFSQPLQYHSNPQSTLSHTTPSSSRSLSATPSTPTHMSLPGKRAGFANVHVGKNINHRLPHPLCEHSRA